jgi:dipeptidyl aminopeptidase/acylaminoacyl peptidase
MRRLSFLLPLVLAAGLAGSAAAELPPLIDRELFFGDPEVSGAQLSPDGKFLSFIKPYQGVRNVYVKLREEPFEKAHPVTADKRPVTGYFWSRDSKYLLYVQDKGGNENFHVYAVDPQASTEAATGVPPARDLTPLENVRAIIFAVPDKTPDVILVGLNDRDATYHDVYKVTISSGDRQLLRRNEQKVGAWIFDEDGNLRLAYRQKDDGGNEILRVDGDQLTRIFDVSYLESADPIQFHKDGKRVYLDTDKGDGVDLSRLVLLDVATGKTELVESDPDNQVDFGSAVFDAETHELMATAYVGDRLRIYPKTKRAQQDLERIRKSLPDGNIGLGSATRDMRYQIVSIQSDLEPGATYIYDRKSGKFDLQYRVRPKLQSDTLAPMKAISFKTRDGLTIHAFLTTPRGVPAKSLPTVIHPHGGPWARDNWGYSSYPQFLANRGYAVLQLNFRGSTGYGKKFLNAGNHEWGTGAMQNDITDAVQYLIAQGIADPKRVAIFGGSYGGYATLAGVTFTPELYACAVPYVAPSNLITLIESFPAYWRPFLKGSWYMRVGDPENPADRADLEKRSPLNFVDRIRVPLLVVHGANDPRVKRSESDRIVMALRDKGAPVEYLVAPDEGHGFRAPNNNMALAAAMEKFFARHLGGRHQESMSEATAKRLAEITVDPTSLKAPAAAATAAAAGASSAALPAVSGDALAPASLTYATAFAMGPQKIQMDIVRTLAESKNGTQSCWRVTETSSGTMGGSTETFDLDRKTLAPVAHEASGMGSIKVSYTANAITGELSGGGQSIPVQVALEAPVLADGSGFEVTLAAMPLAPGYKTVYRVFEPMVQKVRPMQLEVTGEDQLAVAAGSFPVYVVAITPLDGETGGTATLHVMKSAPHHVVKSTTKMPAMMGGGDMTSELKAIGAAK